MGFAIMYARPFMLPEVAALAAAVASASNTVTWTFDMAVPGVIRDGQ